MKTALRLTIIVLLALACPLLGAQNQPPNRQPGFRVAVNMVLVNVSVTSPEGKQQPELHAEDFRLSEDGVEQDIKFFRSAEAPFHVALLVDSSGSTATKLDLIRKAAGRFLQKLAPQDRVSVVDVAGRVEVLQGFTADRRLLSRELRRIGTTKENGTLLRDAIHHILNNLFRGIEGRKAVVFLTDGQDSGSKHRLEQLKQAVYASDAVLYGLLVDTEADLLKTLQEAGTKFSRIALVVEASSGFKVEDVKAAGRYLIDRLPASAQICLVEHRSPRRAVLLVPHTDNRAELKDAITKASVQPRLMETASSWKASGLTVLLTDSDVDLPQRIQADILDQGVVFVLGKRPEKEWQEQLSDLARRIPDPSGLRQTAKELPAKYRDAREAIKALCDHSGGRSFDLVGMLELDNFYQLVAEELRRTYTLGYYSHAAPGQYHRVDVKLPSATQSDVRARRGFLVP